MQQIYIKMVHKLGVMFRKYSNLEFLTNLANCLLIIDDSCEEIYNDKELLATAGRHKNTAQVVSYNRLEHDTHHFVQTSPGYSTSRISRQTVEPC